MNEPKVCIITGANAGIGKHTAIGMARSGYTTVMVARNPEKGRAALAEVKAAAGRDDVELVIGDLGTLATTAALADALSQRYPVIDVLINNAGVWITRRSENAEGIEQTLATNHLAPFSLTLRLLDALKQAEQGRVITVSSALHRRGQIALDDLNTVTRPYRGIQAYADTKLMNILFTRALARRLTVEGSRVTANAVHPGRVKTEISTKAQGVTGALARIFTPVVGPFLKSAAQGAETSIHVALSDEGGAFSGEYFADNARKEPRPRATDDVVGERLWSKSLELVGLPLSP